MFKVIIEKECGCFRRSGILNNKEFASKEQSLEEAKAMVENMNKTFCNKHKFNFVEVQDDIVIQMEMNS